MPEFIPQFENEISPNSLGNPVEQRKLADSYFIKGGTEALKQASMWYNVAAELGDSQSQYMIGLMKYHGILCTIDYDSALHWFMKSCKNGNLNAIYTLGFMFTKGIGPIKSQEKAFEQFSMAASRGSPDAQLMLGQMYCLGKHVNQDYFEALNWFSIAVINGSNEASYQIGAMYASGQGVKSSVQQAMLWFKLSAEMGNVPAKRLIARPDTWPFKTKESLKTVDKPNKTNNLRPFVPFNPNQQPEIDTNAKFDELYSLDNMSREKFLLAYFRFYHIRYIDVRYNKGSIWVVDRPGVKELLNGLAKYGYYFEFTPRGSHTSGYKPAYWLPNRYLEEQSYRY